MIKQKDTSYLDRLFIAAPCPVTWNSMQGGERVRDCSLCSRKVYNLSDMTKKEAEDFIKTNGVNQCMTFYRRADGTIMTDNCPVGLRKLRNSLKRATAFLSSVVTIILSLPSAIAQNNFREAFTPPPAPPGMEYRPNPAGGGYVLRPTTPPGEPYAAPNHTLGQVQFNPGANAHPVNHVVNWASPQPTATSSNGRADSRVLALYLKGKEYEQNGNSLVAALYYQHALKALEHQKSFDPAFKNLIEKQLRAVQHGTQSQP